MAIIGVNPGRQEQQRQQPQVSELDKNLNRILAAVNIANQGFGFALKFDEQDRIQAQTELLQKQQGAVPTPEQVQQQSAADIELTGSKQRREEAGFRKTQAEAQQIELKTPSPEQAAKLRNAEVSKAENELDKQLVEIKNLKNAPNIQNAKDTTALRKEWIANPITKQSQSSISAINKIRSVNENKVSPAGDHSLIFSYMKMVDPTSTVREGEFATVESAGSKIDQATVTMFNKFFKGEMLSPEQREDFTGRAEVLWQSQVKAQEQLDNEYRRLSEAKGLPSDQVILSIDQERAEAPAQFSEEEIKAVMEGANVDRGQAVLRLRAAMGGQ
jgi:NACalpha-BTF3-like transcription factor